MGMTTVLLPIVVSERVQEFNGVKYFLSPGRRYFQKCGKHSSVGLHRAVWIYHNGPIPPGKEWHVHHKDSNPSNNNIENLELLQGSSHIKNHWNDEEWAKECTKKQKSGRLEKLGENWFSKKATKMWATRQPKDYVCSECGKAYSRVYIREFPKHYCSDKCRNKYDPAGYRRRRYGDAGHVAV